MPTHSDRIVRMSALKAAVESMPMGTEPDKILNRAKGFAEWIIKD